MPGSTIWYRRPDTLSDLVSAVSTAVIGLHTSFPPFSRRSFTNKNLLLKSLFLENQVFTPIIRFSNFTPTHVRCSLQSKMKFLIVLTAVYATVSIASPTESAAFKYLNPAAHQVNEDGPPPPGCYWDGTAPFCAGSCPPDYTQRDLGQCGDGVCCWTGYKVLCCK